MLLVRGGSQIDPQSHQPWGQQQGLLSIVMSHSQARGEGEGPSTPTGSAKKAT
jgi:hypothetical protein